MGDRTGIEWTDATWTPIRARRWQAHNDGSGTEWIGWHCEHVTEACRFCYAEAINRRLGTQLDFKPGHLDAGRVDLFVDEKILTDPLRWKRPRMIFVCSMTDLFGRFVPEEMIDRVFQVAQRCPQHTFQILTKRPQRQHAYLSAFRCGKGYRPYVRRPGRRARDPRDENRVLLLSEGQIWPLANVWNGVSVHDQPTADEWVPILLDTATALPWLSVEPMLGPIDLTPWLSRIGWVVAGGESGPNARPVHPDWVRALRDQCAAAGVPFLFKQWGAWLPGQNDPYDGMGPAPASSGGGVRMVAHWQDGAWGARPARQPESRNYVMWAPDGTMHVGGTRSGANYFPVHRWASRVGKKAAGRKLDGRTHDEYPARAA